jgi:hypothetical protein
MESMAELGGLKREGWKVLERGGRKLLKVGTEKVTVYGDYKSSGFCVDEGAFSSQKFSHRNV